MNIEKIKRNVRIYLDEKRYNHVERVANCAKELAERHLPKEVERVVVSAWLHDVAKFFELEKMIQLIKDKYPEVQNEQSKSMAILHGFAGAEFIRENFELFGIEDEEILDGVKYHTIGKENMSTLAKIVYLADAIESARTWEGVDTARELAKINLDEAIKFEIDTKLKYLISKDTIIHPNIILFRNSLISKK